MQHRLSFIALVATLAAAPAVAEAQAFNPQPLDSTSSRAVRARGIVDLVIAGDTTKAIAYLTQHGAPGYGGSDNAKKELLAVMAQVAPNTLRVARYDALGGPLIGLPLAKGESQPNLAVVIGVSPDAPHHVTRLALAKIGGG